MKDDNKIDSNLKLIAKSSVIVFIGIALSKLLTYVYKVIIARRFDPETYGLFSLGVMVLTFFVMFTTLGLSDGTLRYISFYRGRKELSKISYIIRFSIKTQTISSVLGGIILFLFADSISVYLFHNLELSIYLKILSLAVPFSVLANTYLVILLAFEKVAMNSFINNIFQNVAKVIFLILFILLGLETMAVPLSYMFGLGSMLVLSYIFSRVYLSPLSKKYLLKESNALKIRNELISYSWPIIFLGAIYTLFDLGDSLVIGYFMDASNVGIYNAAYTLLALFGIAPEIFKQLFFPLVVKEYSRRNTDIIKELSKQVSKWIFILNLPLFLIVFLFPGAIINIIFGPEYLVGAGVLRVLSIGGLFASSMTLMTSLISMKGRSRLILTNIVIFSCVDFVANIILVPKFGLYGAAYSTAVGLITINIVLGIQVYKNLKFIPLRRKMIRILVVSLIPLSTVAFVKNFLEMNVINLIFLGSLFCLMYILLILLTGCFDKNDWLILKSFKNKILIRDKSKI